MNISNVLCSLFLTIAATFTMNGCREEIDNIQILCGNSFYISGREYKINHIKSSEDFMLYRISYKGAEYVIYEGNGVRYPTRGSTVFYNKVKWVFSPRDQGTAISVTTNKWPRYIAVSTVSIGGQDRLREFLSKVQIRTDSILNCSADSILNSESIPE